MSTINRARLSNRSYRLMVLSLCLVASSAAKATPIAIDVGSSPNITSHIATMFSDLNGTQLQGQTLSLDFNFASGKFARLFSVTDQTFEIAITLNTNDSGLVGFLDGTGSLLDQNGNALGTPQTLFSAAGDNGSMIVAMFPLLFGQYSRPLDFFGMHADLTLPDVSSVMITGGEFQLISGTANPSDVFGIGPGVPRDIVPESGGTLLLLGLVLPLLAAICRRSSPARTV